MGLVVEPQKIALVLGPGALAGWRQIGPLEVLEEHEIPVDLVTSSSVGAINGASYLAGGCSIASARREWSSFKDTSEVFDLERKHVLAQDALKEVLSRSNLRYLRNFAQIMNYTEGLYRVEPIISIISKIDPRRLMARPEEFVATTICRATNKIVSFSTKDPEIVAGYQATAGMTLAEIFAANDPLLFQQYAKMQLVILASGAISGLVPYVAIYHHGSWQEYYDAGHRRPLSILKAIHRGCNTIIVLRCSSDAILSPSPDGAAKRLVDLVQGGAHDHEKTEIKMVRELAEQLKLNFFVVEPKRKISPDFSGYSISPGEGEKESAYMKEVALQALEPLINYFREHPREPVAT